MDNESSPLSQQQCYLFWTQDSGVSSVSFDLWARPASGWRLEPFLWPKAPNLSDRLGVTILSKVHLSKSYFGQGWPEAIPILCKTVATPLIPIVFHNVWPMATTYTALSQPRCQFCRSEQGGVQ